MRPRIAVNCDVESRGRERLGLPVDYLDALFEAGAEPLLLPPDPRALPLLDRADGVLLTGGDDYAASLADPAHLPADYLPIHPRREGFDLRLGREVIERGLPVLGICAGFQLLVLLEGGRIIGDIPSEVGTAVLHRRLRPEDERPRHRVHWRDPGTGGFGGLGGLGMGGLVMDELGTGGETVMSHHHQGIGALPPRWREWAVAEDGVIEGAIGPGRFRVGVQWHPELSPRDDFSRRLFGALADAARGIPAR